MTVTVVGLGLIGGSALRALARAGLTPRGYDVDPATREAARAAGYEVPDELAGAVRGADLVLLAVPLPALPAVLDGLAGYDGLLTDVTSVKVPVRDAVRGRRFVAGHPMAGREHAGFAAGDAALFDGCAWVLCLEPETDLADWLALARLVTRLGARAVPATAAEHDAAVARISHLPHLVAAAVAATAGEPLPAALAAGSFRDGTRVAASPPALCGAMCGGNAAPLTAALDELLADLVVARGLLASHDPVTALTAWFARGHQIRAAWPPVPGEAVTLPADRDTLLALGRAGGWLSAVLDDHTVQAIHPAP